MAKREAFSGFTFLLGMTLTNFLFLFSTQKDMTPALIKVKIIDPSRKLVLIQAQLKNLEEDYFLYFKAPGINTKFKNIHIYDGKGLNFFFILISPYILFPMFFSFKKGIRN